MRVAKVAASVVQDWLGHLEQSVKARRCSDAPGASQDNLTKLAGYLSLLGPSSNPEVQKVYGPLVKLFLARKRVQYLGSNLEHLPATPEGLRKVAAAVEAAEAIEKVEDAWFPVARFIAVALLLEDPAEYVEVSKDFGLDFRLIRTVFHQNTHHRAAKRFRGVVGDLASAEHREEVKKKLKVVR